jgi:hypothetical protein
LRHEELGQRKHNPYSIQPPSGGWNRVGKIYQVKDNYNMSIKLINPTENRIEVQFEGDVYILEGNGEIDIQNEEHAERWMKTHGFLIREEVKEASKPAPKKAAKKVAKKVEEDVQEEEEVNKKSKK